MITMTAQRLRPILIITFAALVLGVASTVALAAALLARVSRKLTTKQLEALAKAQTVGEPHA